MSSPPNGTPPSPNPPPPPPPRGGGNAGQTVLIVFGILAGLSLLVCCGGIGAGAVYFWQSERSATFTAGGPVSVAIAPSDVSPWQGSWLNASTQATYTIDVTSGVPTVTSIVNDDDEVYIVEAVTWDGTTLHNKFRVPSTGYVVEEDIQLDGPLALKGTYTSTAPDGRQNTGGDSWSRIDAALDGAGPAFDFNTPTAGEIATWEGRWLNESTQATYSIHIEAGGPRVTQIVDDEGQLFPIGESRWDGRRMHWRYNVPSTGYTVAEDVRLNGPDALAGDWTSTAPDGTTRTGGDSWSRIRDDEPDNTAEPDGAPADDGVDAGPADPALLAGEWINNSTGATYTIGVADGHVELLSLVDDDGEVYEVQKSVWDGRTVRWKYFVPSTRYTVEETAQLAGAGPGSNAPGSNVPGSSDTLTGTYSSTPPDAASFNGPATWHRKSP